MGSLICYSDLTFNYCDLYVGRPACGTSSLAGAEICSALVPDVTCQTSADCGDSDRPVCKTETNLCIPDGLTCSTPAEDCSNPGLSFCVGGACYDNNAGPEGARLCRTSELDCTPELPVCNPVSGACVAENIIPEGVFCQDDDDCVNDDWPHCDSTRDVCVAARENILTCSENADCTSDLLPVCNTVTRTCIPDGIICADGINSCTNPLLPTCYTEFKTCGPQIRINCQDSQDCITFGGADTVSPICNTVIQTCFPENVICESDADCTDTAQCYPELGICVDEVRPCESSEECTLPGLTTCNRFTNFCVPDTTPPIVCDEDDACIDSDAPVCFKAGCVANSQLACSTSAECDGLRPRCVDDICRTGTLSCKDDLDCINPSLPGCDVEAGVCVEQLSCSDSSDCGIKLRFCDGSTCNDADIGCDNDDQCNNPNFPYCGSENVCVTTKKLCQSGLDCTEALPVCNQETGECEAEDADEPCQSDDDCGDLQDCNLDSGECEAAAGTGCSGDGDCEDPRPICNLDTGLCEAEVRVGCSTDRNCPEAQPVCNEERGICVARDDGINTSTGASTDTVTNTNTGINTNTGTATQPSGPSTSGTVTGNTQTGTSAPVGEEEATETLGSETQSGSATSAAPSGTSSADGNPDTIRTFRDFGCFGSVEGFSGFELELERDDMDLDVCGEVCEGEAYFGVYISQCFCGSALDDTIRNAEASCDVECPGNPSQNCGGNVLSNQRERLLRRQAPADDILLSVYIDDDVVARGGDSAGTDTDSGANGDDTTVTTTFVSTVTEASGSFVTTVTAEVVCNGGRCSPGFSAPVFVLEAYPGADCSGQLVYVPRPCACAGGVEYIPRQCDGSSCEGLTVYKPKESTYRQGIQVFQPEECAGGDCETPGTIFKPSSGAQSGQPGVKTGHGSSSGSAGSSKAEVIVQGNANIVAKPVVDTNNRTETPGGNTHEIVSLADRQMVATVALVVLVPMLVIPALLG